MVSVADLVRRYGEPAELEELNNEAYKIYGIVSTNRQIPSEEFNSGITKAEQLGDKYRKQALYGFAVLAASIPVLVAGEYAHINYSDLQNTLLSQGFSEQASRLILDARNITLPASVLAFLGGLGHTVRSLGLMCNANELKDHITKSLELLTAKNPKVS